MKSLKSLWPTRIAVLAVALSVAVACDDDDGTGPSGTLDPTAAATSVDDVVDRFFVGNDAVNSLEVLSGAIAGQLNVAAADMLPRPESRTIVGIADGVESTIRQLRQRHESAQLMSSIPVGLQGKTLVLNPETLQYEIDEQRTGAPETGVRFILYAVDPIAFQPVQPLEEIGHVDIVDSSSFPTVSVSLTAVVDGTTLLDYDVTGTFGETDFDLTILGFLSDGTDQLDFAFDVVADQTSFDASFSLSFGTFNVTFSFGGDQTGAGTVQVSLSDSASGDTLLFTLSVDAAGVIGSGSGITLNGETIANISGTVDAPEITNAAGDPLSQAELDALEDLFEGMGEMFEVFDDLFGLGLIVLGFGLA